MVHQPRKRPQSLDVKVPPHSKVWFTSKPRPPRSTDGLGGIFWSLRRSQGRGDGSPAIAPDCPPAMALATSVCETPGSSARFGCAFSSGGEAVAMSQITWNVTVGNSPPVNDAAHAVFITSAEVANRSA